MAAVVADPGLAGPTWTSHRAVQGSTLLARAQAIMEEGNMVHSCIDHLDDIAISGEHRHTHGHVKLSTNCHCLQWW